MLKILYLTSHNFERVDSGGTIRAMSVFRLLGQLGSVRVGLCSAYEDHIGNAESSLRGVDLAGVVRFRFTGRRTISESFRYEFDGRYLNTYGYQAIGQDIDRLHALVAEHDMVWIHNLRVANGFASWRWPRSVLDIDDIPSCVHRSAMARTRSFVQKCRHYRQILMWRRREKHLLNRFDALCVCSAPDRNELGRMLGCSDRIHVLPNGFTRPLQAVQRRRAIPQRIGFVGSFHHTPNREGLRWFIQVVWPVILRTMPEVRLRVVGNGGDTEIWKTLENIDVLGWVADVESEMGTWALTVVPIFYGGGTRIKTAEAFSRKCPVVSTPLGVYGYDVTDGAEVLIADSALEFASKCLNLLADPALGVAIAETAWQKFLQHWTWDSYADRVAGVVNMVVQNNGSSSEQEVFSSQ